MANWIFKLLPVLLVGASVSAVADDRVDKLSEDLREWLEMEVVYIITDIEKDIFLDLETREERMRFIRSFWDRRDPDSATLENEFQVEHYRRLDFANKILSRDSPRPGWRTDRGRFYIILGEPSEIQRYDAYNELVATELWIYQGDVSDGLPPRFNLMFYKDNDIGEYELYHPFADGPQKILRAGYGDQRWTVNQNESLQAITGISLDLARAALTIDLTENTGYDLFSGRNTIDPLEMRVRPAMNVDRTLANIIMSPTRRIDTRALEGYREFGHMVSTDYSFKYFPSRSMFSVLYGPDATPFVHFAFEIEPKNFTLESDERKTRHYTTLEVDLELRNLDGQVVAHDLNQPLLQLSTAQFERASAFPVAYRDNYPVLPGDYKVSVVLKNRATRDYTAAEYDLHVPEVVPGTPALSDIVLGYGGEDALSDATVHRSFQIGPREIYPAIGIYSVGESAHAFVQVLSAEPGQELLFELLNPEQEVVEQQRVEAKEGAVVSQLALLGLDGGYYLVRAQLLGEDGAVLATKLAPLTITPRTEVARPAFIYRHSFNTDVPGLLEMATGNQFMASGRIEEARVQYEKAAKNPDLPMAQWRLAGIVLFERDAVRALELLTPLEESYPNEYEVIEGLGFAYYIKKDYAQARNYLERSATLRSPDTSALNALGDCYEQLGEMDKAKDLYQRSLQMNPKQKGVEARLAGLSGGE